MIEITGLPDNPTQLAAYAVLAGFALAIAAKVFSLLFMRWKTPFRVGQDMNVQHAEVVEWADGPKGGEGYVDAGGELWRATSKDKLSPGDPVTVSAVSGLTLAVKRKSGSLL